MATAILTHPAPTSNLAAVCIAYLHQQGVSVSLELVEVMRAELAQIERLTGTNEFEDCELRYALMIAQGEPVGYADVPNALLP